VTKARRHDPIDLLLRRADSVRVLAFFKRLSEGLSVAFADSTKIVPATRGDGPAVSARGNLRRLYLHKALRAAAEAVGYKVSTGFTDPPSWNFPVVRLGAFALTLGIVQRLTPRSPRRLRSRGNYVREHVARNEPVNPQGSLFGQSAIRVVEIIPDGALGAFVVVEPSTYVPDTPLYIGFMVPSPDLRRSYYRCSLERLIGLLQERVAAERKPVRKLVERKKPKLKKRPERPSGE
jgi:hypothetical protein